MLALFRTVVAIALLSETLALGLGFRSLKTASSQDGPVSVTYGSVYETGSIKITPYDLGSLPALPAGYAPLDDKAYLITTKAVVGPPHVTHFKTPSINDKEVFDNLRIFHAQPDTFDPDSPMWVDATILPPEEAAPNFGVRTVNARSDDLGVFVIGKLVQKNPVKAGVADLVVTCNDSPDPVVSPNDFSYTVKVLNRGPQTATEVGLVDALPHEGVFVSATTNQGSCKERMGSLYCKVGSLAVGASATIVIVVKPGEGSGRFPPEGVTTANGAWAAAKEMDSNDDNNKVSETTLLLPDPNLPPSIKIDDPKTGALFVGPANITINATTSDADGTVAKVEFFDNGRLVGSVLPSANGRTIFPARDVTFGAHSIVAVATDNQGRQNTSNAANIIVNGAALVKIVSPTGKCLIAPGSDLVLVVQASHPSGLINKVEVIANGELLGEAAVSGENEYKLELKKIQRALYSIVAIATDASGVTTTSTPVKITVTKPPVVTIVKPSEGASFPSLYNINVTANAIATDGSIMKVDFYSNGDLIGTANDVGTERFMITWRQLPDGVHSLTAVATDELGASSKSEPVKISVGKQSSKP
jgi:uncharacterized repeat protein (TIGR01451 family)